MNINIYLPDELGKRAKDAELNLSPMLRAEVERELERRAALEAAQDGMVPLVVDATDRSGTPHKLRLTGKQITADPGVQVYLTQTGTVLVVFEEGWSTFDTADEFGDWVGAAALDGWGQRSRLPRSAEDALAEAAAELGCPVVVDIT